jgi:hypothetical protein
MPGASLALRRRSGFTPGYGALGGRQDGAVYGAIEVFDGGRHRPAWPRIQAVSASYAMQSPTALVSIKTEMLSGAQNPLFAQA